MIARNSWPFTLLVIVLFAFLLAPVVMVFPLSFSDDSYLVFPPQHWGLNYYKNLVLNKPLMSALGTSLVIGGIVAVASLLIAMPAAYALIRMEFRGRDSLMSLFTAPLLLPSIVLGLAILLVFLRTGLFATYPGIILAHLVVALPYALRVMATSLETVPQAVEEAASSLGASPLTVFRRVTLPMMTPGIIASAALCFLVSFDEVVITLFIAGPKLTTLPVAMFYYVETHVDPMLASLSAMLILVTFLIVIVIERSVGIARALGNTESSR